MSNKVKAEGQCLDVEFIIDYLWRFYVPDLDHHFKCYEEMKEAIERDQARVVAAKRRKLEIAVRTEKGKLLLLTGVHAGHGNPITSPATERFDSSTLYFDTPLVVQALAEKRRLECDVARVDALLEQNELGNRRHMSFNPSMHESEIERIEKAHAAALKNADKPLMEALATLQAGD